MRQLNQVQLFKALAQLNVLSFGTFHITLRECTLSLDFHFVNILKWIMICLLVSAISSPTLHAFFWHT